MVHDQRLAICLAVSTFIVGALILLIKFPATPVIQQPMLSIEIEPTPEPLVQEPEPIEESEVSEHQQTATTQAPSPLADEVDEPAADSESSVDWYAAIPGAISDLQIGEAEAAVFNRALAEKRRAAAEQFAPIPRHEPVPVWENVERDQLGRTILVHGDCQRVIDDPNVGSREAFETFGQYIVTCANFKRPPQKLAWVDEVNARRAGLSRYGHPPAE